MRNNEHLIELRGKVVAVCESIIREEIGVIVGARKLTSLGFEMFGKHDEDFLQFAAIDSETDHLPVDNERKNWSLESLEQKDKEIEEYEIATKAEVFEACKILIKRFNDFKTDPF